MSKTYAVFNSKVEGGHSIELNYSNAIHFDDLDKMILGSFCCLPKAAPSTKPIQDLSRMSPRKFLECSDSCKK